MPILERQMHEKFLRLFTANEPAVRAFVRKLVPSRTDADDVLQEVCIVLWERFGEYKEGESFCAWANGIAKYKALAWIRDRHRDRLVLASDVVDLIAERALRTEHMLETQREALSKCLEKVPSGDRHLLMLAHQPRARIHDVARMSGRTSQGFYQWLHRMRQSLHACVRHEIAQLRGL